MLVRTLPVLNIIFILFLPVCFSQQQELQTSGKASFYHDGLHGLETSSGDMYDKNDFTAAHRTLPFNTLVHVTNKINNKGVVVRINDRGPYKKSRIIDLARSAAQKIEMVPFGVVPVKIRVLDLLDIVPVNDSTFKENEVWDCYGNRTSTEGISVYAWKSEYWKHVFYMASEISVDYNLDDVVVKIAGNPEHRFYHLLISGIKNKDDATALITKLKRNGFKGAKVMK